jgi:hypothetical protein
MTSHLQTIAQSHFSRSIRLLSISLALGLKPKREGVGSSATPGHYCFNELLSSTHLRYV